MIRWCAVALIAFTAVGLTAGCKQKSEVITEEKLDQLLLAGDLEVMATTAAASSLLRQGETERALRLLDLRLLSSVHSVNERLDRDVKLPEGKLRSLRQAPTRAHKYARTYDLQPLALEAGRVEARMSVRATD